MLIILNVIITNTGTGRTSVTIYPYWVLNQILVFQLLYWVTLAKITEYILALAPGSDQVLVVLIAFLGILVWGSNSIFCLLGLLLWTLLGQSSCRARQQSSAECTFM